MANRQEDLVLNLASTSPVRHQRMQAQTPQPSQAFILSTHSPVVCGFHYRTLYGRIDLPSLPPTKLELIR